MLFFLPRAQWRRPKSPPRLDISIKHAKVGIIYYCIIISDKVQLEQRHRLLLIMSATVNPTMLRSILPANPRSLVFKGAKHYRLPANVSYVSLEELESPEEVNTCTKVLVGIVIRYKRSKSSKDGRTLYSRLSQSSKSDQSLIAQWSSCASILSPDATPRS